MPRIGHIARIPGAMLAGLALAALIGGCASTKNNTAGTASVEEMMLENQELRAQLERADENLSTAVEANRSLNDRIQDLTGQLDQCRNDNAELRDSMSSPSMAAATEFDNISGVTVSRQASDIVVEVAGDVLFDSGQVTLKSTSKKTLDQIASVITRNYPSNRIRVAGHTDNDPIRKSPWKTNERLSAERALAVEEYLGSKGVGRDRIEVAAFGAAYPRATKRESRRVEIIILGAS